MTIFFNAFHSPVGAHASFTLGCLGKNGGLGLELGGPADENIYIGLETRKGGSFEALPFFAGAEDESARYDHANKSKETKPLLSAFAHNKISRDFSLATDCFSAGDLAFTIHSPVTTVPDPSKATRADMMAAICPAIITELTIDNRHCKRPRRTFFGYQPGRSNDALHVIREGGVMGIAKGSTHGIFCNDSNVTPAMAFGVQNILKEKHAFNYEFGLGGTGLMLATVPAGKKQTFTFAVCFYRGGIVTTGIPCSYYYERYFKGIDRVASYALEEASAIKKKAKADNQMTTKKKLSMEQQFMMNHAIRSYYGSTQFLDHKKNPIWAVNEGEYRMLNTFDLTVDQLFFEMHMNPWTVKNELDLFTDRYSYTDKVHFPGKENIHPGGISFTHDMGVRNHFTAPKYSSYELAGLDGCFSHMTHEQLVNWVLCAAVYVGGTNDEKWLKKRLPIFKKCLKSMLNRDHPKDAKRNGLMGLDSSRTLMGAEITTYDSLDVSLGQSRNNVYLAVKGWASYLAMADIFNQNKLPQDAAKATQQAERAATTIASFLNKEGFIPAIMGEPCTSRIIPAIEGLVFPHILGMKGVLEEKGSYGYLIVALKTHFETILKKGVCLYPDGGWQLSSTADNSWLSKIYLCQFVARKVLGINTPATGKVADVAHSKWLLKKENLRFAWSDQMCSGVAHGSKYYPRGVTSVLWLTE